MDVKSRKAEQAEATRTALLGAGRHLFAIRGYSDTSTEEIVTRAGVTRGALYHHFRDKSDLFAAVFRQVSGEIADKVRTAAKAAGPMGTWEHFRAGIDGFLDACLDAEVRQIVLLDAPAALGWERWRELDAECGFALTKRGLQVAMDAGLIPPQPLDGLAHILVGALNEAALAMARADDAEKARSEIGTNISRLVEGLRS